MATFDERARDWDTPEHVATATAVSAAIRAAVALRPTDRLIDVGAGTGLLGLALAPDVGSVVLADPSAGMIEVAREKLAAAGLERISALRLDLVADPPPAERFDVAVSQLVLHHVRDTHAALAAILRLLVPGGRIALADLDLDGGRFHTAEAEGIEHDGFDRRAIVDISGDVGFVDVSIGDAAVLTREHGQFSMFLLTGRSPG